MRIATIMPAVAGRKYVSVMDGSGAFGSGVAAGASSMLTAVSANDGQYDLEPAKVAMIVYLPGISVGGNHW